MSRERPSGGVSAAVGWFGRLLARLAQEGPGMTAAEARSGTPGDDGEQFVGWVVLTHSPPPLEWQDDWDDTLHRTLESGQRALASARKGVGNAYVTLGRVTFAAPAGAPPSDSYARAAAGERRADLSERLTGWPEVTPDWPDAGRTPQQVLDLWGTTYDEVTAALLDPYRGPTAARMAATIAASLIASLRNHAPAPVSSGDDEPDEEVPFDPSDRWPTDGADAAGRIAARINRIRDAAHVMVPVDDLQEVLAALASAGGERSERPLAEARARIKQWVKDECRWPDLAACDLAAILGMPGFGDVAKAPEAPETTP